MNGFAFGEIWSLAAGCCLLASGFLLLASGYLLLALAFCF
jgi:hypothetical protein